jgi:acetyl esterase/lipase
MNHQSPEIHPELRQFAGKLPKLSVHAKNLWLWRLLTRLQQAAKSPEDLRVHNIFIPSREGEAKIRLRIYQPKTIAPPLPGLVWLHGGGYVMGRPEMDDPCCIQYAREVGLIVVSVDYRCAPTHPFPTPLEDAYSALAWVHSHAQQLGLDADRIAIGGNSGGGGLAAALAQLARDRHEIQPVFQLLVYPMLDDRTCLRTDMADDWTMLWSQESNRFGWESYLQQPCGAAEVPPYSVPARRTDLSGLPPAWIGVGTLDLFHDEDLAYARRLNECGVACELDVVSGAFHGFDVTAPQAQVVQDFRQSQIAALRRFLVGAG